LPDHAHEVARAFDLRSGERSLLALPPCGVFGFNTALGALAGGAARALEEAFDADRAARLMCAQGIEHLTGSDAMLRAVLDSPELDPACAGDGGRSPTSPPWSPSWCATPRPGLGCG
jgi:hypothetical protein